MDSRTLSLAVSLKCSVFLDLVYWNRLMIFFVLFVSFVVENGEEKDAQDKSMLHREEPYLSFISRQTPHAEYLMIFSNTP
jgi:hypothetical protein